MNTEHATPELFAALAAAQGEIENASKNAANPHFKSRYADLAEILNTTRPVFAKHGLSIVQHPGFDGALASVTTLIGHSGGGYITAVASCVPAKSDAQGIGSATTYLRRYSAAAAAGIAQEDDDGNAAAHNSKPKPTVMLAEKTRPTGDAWERLSGEERTFLQGVADKVADYLAGEDGSDLALQYLHEQKLDSDETIALWTRLDSKQRATLKKAKAAQMNPKQEAA